MGISNGIEIAEKSIGLLEKLVNLFRRKGFTISFEEVEKEIVLCTEGLVTEEKKFIISSKRIFREIHTFYRIFNEDMITSRLNDDWNEIANIGDRYICLKNPNKIIKQKKELMLEFRRELTQDECKRDVRKIENKDVIKELKKKFGKNNFDDLREIIIQSRLKIPIKELPIKIPILKMPKKIYIYDINDSKNYQKYSKVKLAIPVIFKDDFTEIDHLNTTTEGEVIINVKEIEPGSFYSMFVVLSY